MKEYMKKICMCGDSSVGKTSLIRRFVHGKYDEKYITTLGTVISKKLITYPEYDFNVNLQIWDISGQAEFKRIQKSAFRRADGALAICDLTRPETAANLYKWIANLHRVTGNKVPVIVMANKYDLVEGKMEHLKNIRKVFRDLNCPIYSTSAKTGLNVELVFDNLAERLGKGPLVPRRMKAEELVVMPEVFENPFAFLDYALDRYSVEFGDEELSLKMIREQVETGGNEFVKMPPEEALKMMNHMIEVIHNFRSEEEARNLRMEFMEAYKRCRW